MSGRVLGDGLRICVRPAYPLPPKRHFVMVLVILFVGALALLFGLGLVIAFGFVLSDATALLRTSEQAHADAHAHARDADFAA